MIKWLKDTGQEVETNENPANIERAEELGWERIDDAPVDARGLPWCESINTRNRSRDSNGNWKYKSGVEPGDAHQIEEDLLSQMDNG